MTAPSSPAPPQPGPSRGAVLAVVVAAVAVAAAVVALVGVALLPDHGPDATSPSASPPDGDGVAPTGASDDGYRVWDRNADGSPVRWDPCRPIVVAVNPSGAPPGAMADLDEAVRRLRDASGLDLRIGGEVDERPAGDRAPYQPNRYGQRWAPVLVAWAEPGAAGLPLRETDRGIGMPVAVGPEGDRTYVSGQAVLNVDRTELRSGYDDRATSWGATLLHELTHVLGLGHVGDPDELMHVHPGAGPVELGDGDRAGLRAVGAEAGCRDVPDPAPVEVTPPERG